MTQTFEEMSSIHDYTLFNSCDKVIQQKYNCDNAFNNVWCNIIDSQSKTELE